MNFQVYWREANACERFMEAKISDVSSTGDFEVNHSPMWYMVDRTLDNEWTPNKCSFAVVNLLLFEIPVIVSCKSGALKGLHLLNMTAIFKYQFLPKTVYYVACLGLGA